MASVNSPVKGTCPTCGTQDVTLCEVLGRDACVMCGISCGWLLDLRSKHRGRLTEINGVLPTLRP